MSTAITPYKGRDAEPIIDQALELYEQGQEIEESAPSLGVPARTIHRWLATNATDRWREAQQARALSDYASARKARATASERLETLKTQLEAEQVKDAAERNWRLAHAREVLRSADIELDHQKWLLERLLRKLYGQETAAQVPVTIQIANLRGDDATKTAIKISGVIAENVESST